MGSLRVHRRGGPGGRQLGRQVPRRTPSLHALCATGRRRFFDSPQIARKGCSQLVDSLDALPSAPSGEAHLSAQEAQAGPHARVPRAHAYARRPRDPRAPPPQGPQAADALRMGEGPGAESGRSRKGRRRRLSRSAEFERVYREGRSHASRHLVLHSFPRTSDADGPAARDLGRPQGGRRGRAQPDEAPAARGVLVRGRRTSRPGHDFVLVARPDAAELAERGRGGRRGGAARAARRRPGCSAREAAAMTARAVAGAADPALPAGHLAGAAAALQVPPVLLGLRAAGHPGPTAYCAASCWPAGGSCAATPGATAASTPSSSNASSATARPPTHDPHRQRPPAADRCRELDPRVLARLGRASAGAPRSSC